MKMWTGYLSTYVNLSPYLNIMKLSYSVLFILTLALAYLAGRGALPPLPAGDRAQLEFSAQLEKLATLADSLPPSPEKIKIEKGLMILENAKF